MKNLAIVTAFVALSGIGVILLVNTGLPQMSAALLLLCVYFLILGFMVFKPSTNPPGFEKLSSYLTDPGILFGGSIVMTVIFVFFLLVQIDMYLISIQMLIIWASSLGLKVYISRNLEDAPEGRPFSSVFRKKVFTPVAYGFLFSLFLLSWFADSYEIGEMFALIPLAIFLKAVWDFFAMMRNGRKVPPYFPADYIRLFVLSVIAGAAVVFSFSFLSNWNFFSRTPYYMSLIPAATGLFLLVKAYKLGKIGNSLSYILKFAIMFFPFLLLIFHITGFLPIEVPQCYTSCQSNMKNIGTALEMYSADHKGHYPKTLKGLSPEYLREIPRCVSNLKPGTFAERHYRNAYGLTMGDYVYTSSTNPDAYTFYCSGKNHTVFGVGENFPQYNSTTGLISK